MSSPPGFRRPHDAATQKHQLRNAFSALEIHYTGDDDSEGEGYPKGKCLDSPTPLRLPLVAQLGTLQSFADAHPDCPRPLSTAKSFPSLPTNYDDGVQPHWGSPVSEADDGARHAVVKSGEPATQETVKQEQAPEGQLMTNKEAVQAIANLPKDFDAQAMYAADACIFVANLPQNYDDLTLQAAITKVFKKFGTVWVKMKRDKRHMPFAFVQYTERSQADLALFHGRGEDVLGRPCRTKKCGGNLTYIIFRRNNRMVQHDEARIIFSKYGAIAKIENLDYQTQKRLRLPHSLLVHYEMFDARRDVIKSFGHSTVFIIMSYDPKVVQDRSDRHPNDITFMELYDKDRRSAFFGGLPPHTDEDFVRRLAGDCGAVVSVDLRCNPDDGAGYSHIYAFVEFERPHIPDEAVRQHVSSLPCPTSLMPANFCLKNGREIDGHFLRVERKRTKNTESRMRPLPLQPMATIPPLRPHRRVGSMASNHSNHRRVMSHASVPLSPLARAETRYLQEIQAQWEYEQANPRQGPMSPRRAAIVASHTLDDYTPVHSPEKLANMVHFAPSPGSAMSPAGSSPIHYHQPVPVSHTNQSSLLAPSFSARMAAAGRSVSMAFSPAAGNAADRCESAIEKGEDGAKGHRRAASMYIQSTEPLKPADRVSDISESEEDSSWRNSGSSLEEEEFKERKAKSKARLRRSHLSEENLKRNLLCQERLKRAHRSEGNLRSKRGSLSHDNLKGWGQSEKSHKSPGQKSRKSDATLRPPETQIVTGPSSQQLVYQQPVQSMSYAPMAPQYPPPLPMGYSEMPMQPQPIPPQMAPPAPGGFTYMPTMPYPPPQVQYRDAPQVQYHGPPQVQYQDPIIQYHERSQVQYQGPPRVYGEHPQAQYHDRPPVQYSQPPQQMQYRGPSRQVQYQDPYVDMAYPSYATLRRGDFFESPTKIRQRLEAERYRRYNGE
ncbi:hypothetical protein FSARC_6234 [Fusarium sarcochroum]|uniref:RRM domain-containing protein n=1 Tax=Fusarium sarcochroum TaxID=1208366 RepID=A0A8H4X9K3_9HYPO|nr:hypothetical protein FSARC_6234 [Fusarium sarcochroum]